MGSPSGLRVGQPDFPNFPSLAASHTRFNPSLSSTYSTNGQTFSLQYGSGSLTGFFGYDTLTVSDTAGCPRAHTQMWGRKSGAVSWILTSKSSQSDGET